MISTRPARDAGSVASAVAGVLGLVFLPKCPLCVGALLTAAGLGASSAGLVAPWLRPGAALLALAAFLVAVSAVARAVVARRGRSSCCTITGTGTSSGRRTS